MGRRATSPRPLRAALGAAAVVALWYVTLAPSTLGGPVTPILTRGTSMLPDIETGDVVISYRDPRLEVGEIAAFRGPAGALVLHRIVAIDGDRVITKGDNLGTPDPWDTRIADVVGTARIHVPGMGPILDRLREPLVLASLVALAGVSLFLLTVPPSAGLGGDPTARPARRRDPRDRRRWRRPAGLVLLLGMALPIPGSLASLDVVADQLTSTQDSGPFPTYVDTPVLDPPGGPGGGNGGGNGGGPRR